MSDHVSVSFTATCLECPWEGRPRANNLVALADYDKHVVSPDHLLGIAELARAIANDEDPGRDSRGPETPSPFAASAALLDR